MSISKSDATAILSKIEKLPTAGLIADLANDIPQSLKLYQLAQWLLTGNFPLGEDYLNELRQAMINAPTDLIEATMLYVIGVIAMAEHSEDVLTKVDNAIRNFLLKRINGQFMQTHLALIRGANVNPNAAYFANFLLTGENPDPKGTTEYIFKFLIDSPSFLSDFINDYTREAYEYLKNKSQS